MAEVPEFIEFEQAAAAADRVAAWGPAVRIMGWLSDDRNEADAKLVKKIVRTAADRRWFDMAELLAATAVRRIEGAPATRRLHAQMLMERGLSEEALSRLRSLLAQRNLPRFEREEAEGHIGRIFKDRFLEAAGAGDESASRSALGQSLKAYLDAYESENLKVWHGINAVALLSRREAVAVRPDAKALAAAIANAILKDALVEPDEYTPATLAEAHIALRQFPNALAPIRQYTADPRVNPFQLATFHKQLTKVWMLDRESSPGPEL